MKYVVQIVISAIQEHLLCRVVKYPTILPKNMKAAEYVSTAIQITSLPEALSLEIIRKPDSTGAAAEYLSIAALS